MKWMLKQTYDNLPEIYLNEHHRAFKKMKDGTILKTVRSETKDVVYKLVKKKKIEHVIFPSEVIKILSLDSKLAYTQEYVEKMENLSSFSKFEEHFSEKEIMLFFRSMLTTLSHLHKSGVVSGDITYSNIIMDSNLDYNFIDFELAFVDEKQGYMVNCTGDAPYLSHCDEEVLRSLYSEKEMFLYLDKANLVNMMLYAFLNGRIASTRNCAPFYQFLALEMDEWATNRFRDFLAPGIYTEKEDYMLDAIDYLIETNYQFPYRKVKGQRYL